MGQEIVEVTVRLPDNLAREAQASGLLTPQALGTLLQDELGRRRIDRLFQAADRLAELAVPPLTEVELEAEIKAARRAKRSSKQYHGIPILTAAELLKGRGR